MIQLISRRTFTATAVAATFATRLRAFAADSPFHIGVISDEISQDFDHACSVIAHDFGLHFVELRGHLRQEPPVLLRRRARPSREDSRQVQPYGHRHRQSPL